MESILYLCGVPWFVFCCLYDHQSGEYWCLLQPVSCPPLPIILHTWGVHMGLWVSSLSGLPVFLCSWTPLSIWSVCWAHLFILWWCVTRCLVTSLSSVSDMSPSDSRSAVNSRGSSLFSLCVLGFKAMCYPVLWNVLAHVTNNCIPQQLLQTFFAVK